MAAAQKESSRGPKQDRARAASGQDHDVRYESRKTGSWAATVKRTVNKVGNARVEQSFGR